MSGFLFADLSDNNHHDGTPFDFKAAKADGLDGVMVKATQGMSYVNPFLHQDAEGARAAGMHVGFYHYAMPDESGGGAQADFCMTTCKPLAKVRDLGIALDLEETGGLSWRKLSAWGKQFVTSIAQKEIGSPLYSNENYLAEMPDAPWGHHLWLALPGASAPRRKVWAWQYSWNTYVNGIPGPIDFSHYYG